MGDLEDNYVQISYLAVYSVQHKNTTNNYVQRNHLFFSSAIKMNQTKKIMQKSVRTSIRGKKKYISFHVLFVRKFKQSHQLKIVSSVCHLSWMMCEATDCYVSHAGLIPFISKRLFLDYMEMNYVYFCKILLMRIWPEKQVIEFSLFAMHTTCLWTNFCWQGIVCHFLIWSFSSYPCSS